MTGQKPAAAEEQPAAPMVPLAEAAAMTGRPAEALRSMIRRGRLRSTKGNDGRLLVEVPSWLLAGQQPAEDGRLAGLETTIAELREEIAELRERLVEAESQARAAQAVAVADVDAARRIAEAEKAHMATLVDELRRELDWHRRPWWRRLIG